MCVGLIDYNGLFSAGIMLRENTGAEPRCTCNSVTGLYYMLLWFPMTFLACFMACMHVGTLGFKGEITRDIASHAQAQWVSGRG
jgi:hypothetical protein